jgi:hypothetical protein
VAAGNKIFPKRTSEYGPDTEIVIPEAGSLTPELPESPEGALFFAQILKLHIAYMRIYGV